MKVYLAGKIPKGDQIGKLPDWREEYGKQLTSMSDLEILSPESRLIDETDSMEVFGFDCMLISSADLVIVKADQKLGVGTAEEILIAKYFKKTVAVVLPPETPHRRSNFFVGGHTVQDWKHPFIAAPSDFVFSSLEELIASFTDIEECIKHNQAKGIDVIDKAIAHFKEKNPEY